MNIDEAKARVRRASQTWTVIATRPREELGTLLWRPVTKPAFSLGEANVLAREGFLLLANRHKDDQVELVAKPSKKAWA